jgi:bifunctional DNA-binding transcriptional regulator/antitoxin component of YhaV-PrlF toxin-antitoxin module
LDGISGEQTIGAIPMPAISSKTVTMSSGGRLVIPADMRRELGLEEGVAVILKIQNAALTIQTKPAAMAKAKALIAQYVPAGISLADELIADRRAEAAAEDE